MRNLLTVLLCCLAPAIAIAGEPVVQEVLVTATRSTGALLDYPGSATRIGGETLRDLGATHHSEAVNRAPGSFIQRGNGQESLTGLRSPVLSGAGACGAFLFLEDGVPLRPVGFCNINELFEVNGEQAAAIEVLRGPGSALYGSNAVHGIVNVIPPLPSDLPPLGLAAEFGENKYLRARLVAAGHGSAGDLGVALHATHDGGWRDESGFDEQKLSAALVRPFAGGSLTVRLNATNLDQETAGFIVGENAYRDDALARSNPSPEAFRDAWSARLAAHYEVPQAGGRLDLTGYARSSHMTFLQHFLLGQPLEDNGQDSAGFQLSRTWYEGDVGRLVLGLDGELARGSLREFQEGPTTGGTVAARAIRPAGLHYDYDVRSAVLAGYAHWEHPLSATWRLTAGLRLEQVRYGYDNRMLAGNTDENGIPCGFGGCLYSRPEDRSDAFTNVGPRIGVTWRPGPESAAWLSLTQGYRPPEATELYRLQRQQQVADLESEQARGAEAGYRRLGERGSVSIAAFWLDKRHVILRDANAYNVSDGRTHHRGIEYEARWLPAAGWRLEAAGTVARHTYAFSRLAEQGERIEDGNDVDTAPRQLHTLLLGYSRGPWWAEAEWAYVGAYWADAANTSRYPGHELLNLRARWESGRNSSIALRVTNLLDRAYADRADYAQGSYRYFPGRGRTAFIEFSWRRK